MRPLLSSIFLSLLLFGVNGSNSDPNERIFKEYQFPARGGLTHLCQQRVYGSGVEIIWDAFSSNAPPSELVKFYQQKLGKAGFTAEGKGGMWRLPADAARPERVLEIMPAGAEGPYRSCEKSPPASARTILTLSKMS